MRNTRRLRHQKRHHVTLRGLASWAIRLEWHTSGTIGVPSSPARSSSLIDARSLRLRLSKMMVSTLCSLASVRKPLISSTRLKSAISSSLTCLPRSTWPSLLWHPKTSYLSDTVSALVISKLASSSTFKPPQSVKELKVLSKDGTLHSRTWLMVTLRLIGNLVPSVTPNTLVKSSRERRWRADWVSHQLPHLTSVLSRLIRKGHSSTWWATAQVPSLV